MRIPYVPNPPPPSTLTAEEEAVYARVSARRHPRPLQPLDLALLHSPPVADGWNSFLGAVRNERTSSLSAADRELAICRVAVCNGAWYEWAHHAPLAAAAGVGEEALRCVVKEGRAYGEMMEMEEGKDEDESSWWRDTGLTDRQWAVLRYTDEMTRSVRVSDATFDRIRAVMTEREIVEVTATIAAYNCVSRFLVALDVGERNATRPEDV